MFTPVVEILRILPDSSAMYVKDITPTGGTTGYGSANAPANSDAITSFYLSLFDYGSEVSVKDQVVLRSTDFVSDAGQLFTLSVPDGVVLLKAHFGEQKTIAVTVATNRLSLTISGAGTLFAGVTYVSLDGTTLSKVLDITGNTITLETPFAGTASSYPQIYRFYTAELRAFVLYKANRTIAHTIERFSCKTDLCGTTELMDKIILKESAEYNYSLGFYAKANESAKLITGTLPAYNSIYKDCE